MIKKVLVIVGIIVLIIVLVTIFSGKNETQTGSLISSSGDVVSPVTGEDEIGEEFLVTLLNLRTIQLDETLFSDQKFRSLEDFTITLIPEGNVGRSNPFAPIGTDVDTTTAGTTTSSTSFTTPTPNTQTPVPPPSGTVN